MDTIIYVYSVTYAFTCATPIPTSCSFIAATFSYTDVLVLPLGMTKKFVCISPPGTGHGIVWHVNGASAASSQLPYIALEEEVQTGDGGIQRNITFTADTRANNTHIRCVISNFEGDSHISVDLNLTLQGQSVMEVELAEKINMTSPLRSSISS